MLKNTEKYESQTHFSNRAPQKRVNKTSGSKDVTVFISVFIIGVLIILGFAKILSPNVDVGIAGDEDFAGLEENSSRNVIDERLRKLQLEDFVRKSAEDAEMFSPELDEKVVLPKQLHKTVGEMEAEMLDKKQHEQKVEEPKIEEKIEGVENSPELVMHNSSNVTARVVVGYYASEKQAEVAKSIIQDAGLGVTPIVKNMGTYYTLQVGSYSSKDKAQQAANNLLKNNFPARVVVE